MKPIFIEKIGYGGRDYHAPLYCQGFYVRNGDKVIGLSTQLCLQDGHISLLNEHQYIIRSGDFYDGVYDGLFAFDNDVLCKLSLIWGLCLYTDMYVQKQIVVDQFNYINQRIHSDRQ